MDRRETVLRSAAVVGTGLIGTSVALALRARGVTTYLLDRDPEAARTAASLGAGIAGAPPARVDLAVLAVPPSATATALHSWQRKGLAESYTDVASVKSRPQADMTRLGCDLPRFVGGHPMAGREYSGPLAAQADLFHGRTWVLTPSAFSGDAALSRAHRLVELCGGRPLVMDHAEHDRAVALTSHAPHLIASLMAARLADGEESELRLAGQGLRDTTRIAAGDAELWGDILGCNAGAVHDVLTEVASDLGEVLVALRRLSREEPEPDGSPADGPPGSPAEEGMAALRAVLTHGIEGRARITGRGAAVPGRILEEPRPAGLAGRT
ncbi:prephenate dehydrogenase [Streptomyces sp. NPDC005355]|uniref:prephenate dehydrogenase n=1 Tax=Streptomyces sp. NPDC005355 TaxID=3157038 RepID=UPI0033AA6646